MTFKPIAGLAAAFAIFLMPGSFQAAGAQTPAASSEPGVPSLARAIKDSNKTYLGWRVFQENCARCHGPDATGTRQAPDLLPRVKAMSETRFIGTVLRRYNWVLSGEEAGSESGARDALVQAIIERQKGQVVMPAWEGEPAVKAHLDDLYEYLTGRASGAIGPERPSWPGK
jgi:hypothetical protein